MSQLSPALLAQLQARITERHLEDVRDEILKNAAECYAMVTVGDDDYSTVGNTRFGGDPDLPAGWEWPVDPDRHEPNYSNFIAQINFAELPALSAETGLPSKGILYLFVRDMYSAGCPVILDSLYFDGELGSLARRTVPDTEALCDEYLVNLNPQRMQAVPTISFPIYRESFREYVRDQAPEIDGENGESRLYELESDLNPSGQIGQLLGFANAGDVRDNRYRKVALSRLGKRDLQYNDYWETMEEYEAYIEEHRSSEELVQRYKDMREGVVWLTSQRELISAEVNEWQMLLRINSNRQMDLWINDADPLYVFVKRADLASRNFSDLAGEVTQG